jgi:hypothetical protein
LHIIFLESFTGKFGGFTSLSMDHVEEKSWKSIQKNPQENFQEKLVLKKFKAPQDKREI